MITDRNLVGTSATFKNDDASTLSIFDQDLELENTCVQYTRKLKNGEVKTYTYETCRLFTYNRFNVEAAQKYLIPRAVAYSAGLINHFFRGRLDVTKTEQTTDTAGNAVVAITIKNTSTQDFAMSNGKLEIFYDAIVDGVEIRKPAQFSTDTTGDIVLLSSGAEKIIKIILPTDIDDTKANPFVVVFRGGIGADPGVAGKVFNVTGETAILLFYQKDANNILLRRSIDKGKSWNDINDPAFDGFKLFNGSSKGTQFLPSNKGSGLLVGKYGTGFVTLRTIDNGKIWSTFLDQNFGEYTEILNVAKAVHVGGGHLITYNNYFSGTVTIGTKTYYSYDVELSQSFDDGQSWSPISLPFTIEAGGASHLYYLGNNHLYLLTYGYDYTCACTKRILYESFNLGQSFSKASLAINELEWNYGFWYRDAYAFDTGEIITTKNVSGTLDYEEYRFGISNDGGGTLNITDKAAKNTAWPQAEPINLRPIGQGEFVSYVFDPWTAYAKDLASYYEGVLVSEDRGITWSEVYSGNVPTAGYPYFLMMGVLTEDVNKLKYIH